MKSPLYRRVKLWDMIPDNFQRSVTKVKFKTMLKVCKIITLFCHDDVRCMCIYAPESEYNFLYV